MAILLKCGALFYHIPKTGGNWISEVLEEQDLVFANVGGRHVAQQLRGWEDQFRLSHRYKKPNRPFYRFCFVRHPLRWYESWFRMQQGLGWTLWEDTTPYWFPPIALNGLGSPDFNVFIANVIKYKPGFVTSMYNWYTACNLHFVGQQEHLADDLIRVLRVLRVPFDENKIREHAPANTGTTSQVTWDPVLETRILELEATALRTFGYDGPAVPMLPQEEVLLAPPFRKMGTYAYAINLPQYTAYGDDAVDPYRSLLVVLENGVPLRKGHMPHKDIADQGTGLYSHWRNSLVFSASDNSDPNVNGKRYSLVVWLEKCL